MFSFGSLSTLDLHKTMFSMFVVMVFIMLFDFATKMLEYCLEDYPLYNRMLQNIYKELMQMGLISFIVVLYEAGVNHQMSAENKVWVISIDFSHMLLFFVALNFVLHAFYLMFISFQSARYYLEMDCCRVSDLLDQAKQRYFVRGFIDFIYISDFRSKLEYKVAQVLFRDTYYRLPKEFNFSLYLTKCFQHYALRTMEVGSISWVVVAILVVCNFIRVKFYGPFSCKPHLSMTWRRLASSSSSKNETISNECSFLFMKLFFSCAVILCLYTLIMLYMARVYYRRLLRRAGVRSRKECIELLQYCEDYNNPIVAGQRKPINCDEHRLSAAELRAVIEEFLDVKEHDDEKKLYRETWELFASIAAFMSESCRKVYSCVVMVLLRRKKPMTADPTRLTASIFATSGTADDSGGGNSSADGGVEDIVGPSPMTRMNSVVPKSKLNAFGAKRMESSKSAMTISVTTVNTTQAPSIPENSFVQELPDVKSSPVSGSMFAKCGLQNGDSKHSPILDSPQDIGLRSSPKALPVLAIPSIDELEEITHDVSDFTAGDSSRKDDSAGQLRAPEGVTGNNGSAVRRQSGSTPTAQRKVSWGGYDDPNVNIGNSGGMRNLSSSSNLLASSPGPGSRKHSTTSSHSINVRKGSNSRISSDDRKLSISSGGSSQVSRSRLSVKRGSVDLSPSTVLSAKLSIHKKAVDIRASGNAKPISTMLRGRTRNTQVIQVGNNGVMLMGQNMLGSTTSTSTLQGKIQHILQTQLQAQQQARSAMVSPRTTTFSQKVRSMTSFGEKSDDESSHDSSSSHEEHNDDNDAAAPLDFEDYYHRRRHSSVASIADGEPQVAIVMDSEAQSAPKGRRRSVLGSGTTLVVQSDHRPTHASSKISFVYGGGIVPQSSIAQDVTITAAEATVSTIVGNFLLTKSDSSATTTAIKSSSNDSKSWFLGILTGCLGFSPKVLPNSDGMLSEDFSGIFMFRSPGLFYRCVELAIMLNCLYMAMWATNFITITLNVTKNPWLWNILMVIPIILNFYCIGKIAQSCSFLKAVTEVDANLSLICDVIVDMEDREILQLELREKILSKISAFDDKKSIFKQIFHEIDLDQSNNISKGEFREFLRMLELKYSDARFHRLFDAVNRNGTDYLTLEDLNYVLFECE